jgi:hypothetical protein
MPSDHDLLALLRTRFLANRHRHPDLDWQPIEVRLLASASARATLAAMEATGGEPDVIGFEADRKAYLFCDCAKESPAGRRSLCYDAEAQRVREKKGVYPQGNVLDMAQGMGVSLLTEAEYHRLQTLEPFDTRTESWLLTPPRIRELGGALFGDRRYERVFVFHNSAPSFFAGRGFRGTLWV